jgi:predicted acetyltransferase
MTELLHLADPTEIARSSFLEAIGEFQAEGRCGPGDDSLIGRDFREFGDRWSTDAGFATYLERGKALALEETVRGTGWVPCSTWWWLDGTTFLGRISLRHRLNESLVNVGGHIGYDVRPSARRKGHATAMLRAVLPRAKAMGIQRALLTCDDDNVGSIGVIEGCHGQLEDVRRGKRRYWIAT